MSHNLWPLKYVVELEITPVGSPEKHDIQLYITGSPIQGRAPDKAVEMGVLHWAASI